MLVVFGKDSAEKLKSRMTVLELDTFMQSGLESPLTVYAVLEMSDIPFPEIPHLESLSKLHNTMMEEYRARRFEFCEQALESLLGKWNKTLDSFYMELSQRLVNLKSQNLDENWNGIIYKENSVET